MNTKDTDSILDKINSLDGTETQQIPWLITQLDSEVGSVRYSALSVLVHHFSVPELEGKYWVMLNDDSNEDVVTLLISTLGSKSQGTNDANLIARFQRAVARFARCYTGMREALEDAKP